MYHYTQMIGSNGQNYQQTGIALPVETAKGI
jgi:hypothetical protein